ncbi:MAG: phage DNA encapsidation protein [Bacteroidales bacterium]|nr:phage DNA encapsidation protein [Bacteroidales bacterium]
MSKIYNSEGWVNWDYILSQNSSFISVVGARGTGKTYGLFKALLEREEKFIYLRRLKSQLEQCSKPEGNPFKKLNTDLDYDVQPFVTGGNLSFRDTEKTGRIRAVGVALSVVANVRGTDYSDFDYIVFDEFIANIGERPIKNEFKAFENFYETVNRNRELEGKKAVKCIMLGNANTLVNPYFSSWHFMRTALKMIAGKQMVWRSKDSSRMVIMLLDSPISERKRETALYKNADSDFIEMALDNSFRTDETNIRSEPIKEYIHLVSVGEIGIYKHKSERKYYVSTITGKPYYDSFGIGLKMFQQDFYMLRVHYMINKNVWFESFELEIIFREIFNLH